MISKGTGKPQRDRDKISHAWEVLQKWSLKTIHADRERMRKDTKTVYTESGTECFIVLTHFTVTTALRSRYYYLPHLLMRKSRHREVK